MRPRDIQVRKDSRLFAEVCSAVLRQGHLVQFRVQGKSMRPNLLDGDVVVVAPADSQDLRRGDVALTRNPDGLLVHRVTSVDAFHGFITTRGDAGIESDPFSTRVFGKVVTRQHGERCESFGMLRTRVLHPLRIFVCRALVSAARRLRRAAT